MQLESVESMDICPRALGKVVQQLKRMLYKQCPGPISQTALNVGLPKPHSYQAFPLQVLRLQETGHKLGLQAGDHSLNTYQFDATFIMGERVYITGRVQHHPFAWCSLRNK